MIFNIQIQSTLRNQDAKYSETLKPFLCFACFDALLPSPRSLNQVQLNLVGIHLLSIKIHFIWQKVGISKFDLQNHCAPSGYDGGKC